MNVIILDDPHKEIEVKVIGVTQGGDIADYDEELSSEQLLVYTKQTRLQQGEETRKKIKEMSVDDLNKELEYMANTIPSSWEFIDYVFEIKNVTRAFTHQFVRTRTGSYAQQTMRLLEKKNFTYRIPPSLLNETEKTSNIELSTRNSARAVYNNTMSVIQSGYDKLLEMGVPAEDARGVLPTNIHTNIIAKFNLRTLAEMAKGRAGKRTQDEYREVLDQMLDQVVCLHPWAGKFLFPANFSNIKMLEDFIERVAKEGSITDAEKYDLWKACDKLRKGDN